MPDSDSKDVPVLEVLLVEDDPAHAELIQRAFATRGKAFHLTIAPSVTEARQRIETQPPALIITDWLLPDGQGTDLIDKNGNLSNVPVILMTSHGNERVAVEALKAGALDYIVKSESTLADMPHTAERALREWDNIIQRKRVEQELRRRVAELEVVNRVSTSLRSAIRKDQILECLLEEILAHLKAETGLIWLYRPETAQLEPACGRGWLAENTVPIGYGRCVAGFVFVSGETRISDNLVNDPLAEEGIAKNFLPGWRGAWIPIRTAEEVVGVLLIAFPPTRPITTDEIHLLTTIAEMAGNAIHRAHLYEQTERNLQRLNALRTIDIAITSSTELRLSLSVLLTQARLLLDADAIVILKVNPLLQTLEFLAGKNFPSTSIENVRLRLGQGYAGIVAVERRLISIPNTTKSIKAGNRMDSIRTQTFQAYHAVPLIARGHLKGVLEVFHKHPFQPSKDWLETLDALAGQAAIAIENAELFDELEKSNTQLRLAYDATIEGWSRALDMRDRETEGHTQRVAEMTVDLARLMGFTEEELVHIRRGALLHDIGKMAIPDSILNKPAPLTESEWKIMRQHPTLAKTMLASIEYLRPALDIPYHHHERWNGSGYPDGLKGEAIPLAARIFAVVDVWDALRAPRPYRQAWPAREIEHFLETESGRLFDPQVVKLFLQKVAR